MLTKITLAYLCALPQLGFVPPAQPSISAMAMMWRAAEECRIKTPTTPCLKHFFVRDQKDKPGYSEAAWECSKPEQVPL